MSAIIWIWALLSLSIFLWNSRRYGDCRVEWANAMNTQILFGWYDWTAGPANAHIKWEEAGGLFQGFHYLFWSLFLFFSAPNAGRLHEIWSRSWGLKKDSPCPCAVCGVPSLYITTIFHKELPLYCVATFADPGMQVKFSLGPHFILWFTLEV